MKLTTTNITKAVDDTTFELKFTAQIDLTMAYEDIQDGASGALLADMICLELGRQLIVQLTKAM